MIHYDGPENEDYCNLERLDPRQAFPCSHHCHHDGHVQYLPYEFSSTPVPTPDLDFLSEVATYLRLHHLCDAIAVSHIANPRQPRSERLSDDGRGTIAKVIDNDQLLLDEECINTEWSVTQDDAGVSTVATRACKDREAGHVKVAD